MTNGLGPLKVHLEDLPKMTSEDRLWGVEMLSRPREEISDRFSAAAYSFRKQNLQQSDYLKTPSEPGSGESVRLLACIQEVSTPGNIQLAEPRLLLVEIWRRGQMG